MAGYSATPLGVDNFSRFFVDMYDERTMLKNGTVWQQFFGDPSNGSKILYSPDSNDVDIDIIRGTEYTAALVPRGTISRKLGATQKNVESERYSTFSRKFPLAEEESDINANQLLLRKAGESSYERRDRMNRLRKYAVGHVQEHMRRMIRLDEILAGQSVMTGQQVAILGTTDTDLIYDFRRNSANTFAASAVWTTAGTDILGDMDDAWTVGRQNGKVNLDMMITGESVAPGIMSNTKLLALLDNRRIQVGLVSSGTQVPPKYQKFVDAGLVAQGYIVTETGKRFWWFTYPDYYENNAGTFVPYMPVDGVMFATPDARCDAYYGPAERLPVDSADRQWYQEVFGFSMDSPPMPPNIQASGVVRPGSFYFDAIKSNDRKKISMRTQHAPIFATTMTDAFVRITGAA